MVLVLQGNGDAESIRVPLIPKDVPRIIFVGRAADSDIKLSNKSVSGRHARIEIGSNRDYKVIVHDYGSNGSGSRFGTLVGEDHLVGSNKIIKAGDALCFGTAKYGAHFHALEMDTSSMEYMELTAPTVADDIPYPRGDPSEKQPRSNKDPHSSPIRIKKSSPPSFISPDGHEMQVSLSNPASPRPNTKPTIPRERASDRNNENKKRTELSSDIRGVRSRDRETSLPSNRVRKRSKSPPVSLAFPTADGVVVRDSSTLWNDEDNHNIRKNEEGKHVPSYHDIHRGKYSGFDMRLRKLDTHEPQHTVPSPEYDATTQSKDDRNLLNDGLKLKDEYDYDIDDDIFRSGYKNTHDYAKNKEGFVDHELRVNDSGGVSLNDTEWQLLAREKEKAANLIHELDLCLAGVVPFKSIENLLIQKDTPIKDKPGTQQKERSDGNDFDSHDDDDDDGIEPIKATKSEKKMKNKTQATKPRGKSAERKDHIKDTDDSQLIAQNRIKSLEDELAVRSRQVFDLQHMLLKESDRESDAGVEKQEMDGEENIVLRGVGNVGDSLQTNQDFIKDSLRKSQDQIKALQQEVNRLSHKLKDAEDRNQAKIPPPTPMSIPPHQHPALQDPRHTEQIMTDESRQGATTEILAGRRGTSGMPPLSPFAATIASRTLGRNQGMISALGSPQANHKNYAARLLYLSLRAIITRKLSVAFRIFARNCQLQRNNYLDNISQGDGESFQDSESLWSLGEKSKEDKKEAPIVLVRRRKSALVAQAQNYQPVPLPSQNKKQEGRLEDSSPPSSSSGASSSSSSSSSSPRAPQSLSPSHMLNQPITELEYGIPSVQHLEKTKNHPISHDQELVENEENYSRHQDEEKEARGSSRSIKQTSEEEEEEEDVEENKGVESSTNEHEDNMQVGMKAHARANALREQRKQKMQKLEMISKGSPKKLKSVVNALKMANWHKQKEAHVKAPSGQNDRDTIAQALSPKRTAISSAERKTPKVNPTSEGPVPLSSTPAESSMSNTPTGSVSNTPMLSSTAPLPSLQYEITLKLFSLNVLKVLKKSTSRRLRRAFKCWVDEIENHSARVLRF